MRAARTIRGSVLMLGAVLLSGCYSYMPVERPTPGTTVRIHVPAIQTEVRRTRNDQELVSFEGRVVSFGDSLLLEIESRREMGAYRELTQLDTLHVAQSNLADMEERYFSKPKTYGFAALVTAGAVGLGIAVYNVATGQGGNNNGGNNTTQTALVLNPVFSGLLRALGR